MHDEDPLLCSRCGSKERLVDYGGGFVPVGCSDKECRRKQFVKELRASVVKHGNARLSLDMSDDMEHIWDVMPKKGKILSDDDDDREPARKLIGFGHYDKYSDDMVVDVTAEQFAENPELCFELRVCVEDETGRSWFDNSIKQAYAKGWTPGDSDLVQ
jgi:hypothetical protein